MVLHSIPWYYTMPSDTVLYSITSQHMISYQILLYIDIILDRIILYCIYECVYARQPSLDHPHLQAMPALFPSPAPCRVVGGCMG